MSHCYRFVENEKGRIHRVKYWEIIADNLSKAGFSWGCSSEIDSTGRVLYTADAYARDGRHFTVLVELSSRAADGMSRRG
jgi:hypothetical protein